MPQRSSAQSYLSASAMKDGAESLSKQKDNVNLIVDWFLKILFSVRIQACPGQTLRGHHSDENDSNFIQCLKLWG